MGVRRTLLLLLLAAPANALVVGYDPVGCAAGALPNCTNSFGDPNSSDYVVSYNQVTDGVNLNGEVMLNITYADGGAATCTGSLLSDGESILTAAHCLDPVDPNTGQLTSATQVQVYFDQGSTPAEGACGWFCGAYVVTDVSNFFVDPTYIQDGGAAGDGADLAVVRLNSPAPSQDQGYSLYTGTLTTSDVILLAGLGESGQGYIDGPDYPAGIQGGVAFMRQGQNTYVGTCPQVFGVGVCSPYDLIGQFYSANPVADQVEVAPGDSGGGSFYDGELVGVHSFDDCFTSSGAEDYGCSISNNSYFGDTSVSGANATWIWSVEVSSPEPAPLVLTALGGLLLLAGRRLTARNARRERESFPLLKS